VRTTLISMLALTMALTACGEGGADDGTTITTAAINTTTVAATTSVVDVSTTTAADDGRRGGPQGPSARSDGQAGQRHRPGRR